MYFNLQHIQPKMARIPTNKQTDDTFPIFRNTISVLDNCFSTHTLSFDILLITEIKESHLL